MASWSFFHSLWTTLLCFLRTFSLLFLRRRRRTPSSPFSTTTNETPSDLSSPTSSTERQCCSQQFHTVSLSRISRTLSQARISLLSLQNVSSIVSVDDSQMYAELGQSQLTDTCRVSLSSTPVAIPGKRCTKTVGLGFLSPELFASPRSLQEHSGLSMSPDLPSVSKSVVERSVQQAEKAFSIIVVPGPTCHGAGIEGSLHGRSMSTKPEADGHLSSSLITTHGLSYHNRSFSLVSAAYSEMEYSMDSSPNLRAALASCDTTIEFFSILKIFQPLRMFSAVPPLVSPASPSKAMSRSRSKSSPAHSQRITSTPVQFWDPTQTSTAHARDKRHTLSLAEARPFFSAAIHMNKHAEKEETEEVVISPFRRSWASDELEMSLCALSDY